MILPLLKSVLFHDGPLLATNGVITPVNGLNKYKGRRIFQVNQPLGGGGVISRSVCRQISHMKEPVPISHRKENLPETCQIAKYVLAIVSTKINFVHGHVLVVDMWFISILEPPVSLILNLEESPRKKVSFQS